MRTLLAIAVLTLLVPGCMGTQPEAEPSPTPTLPAVAPLDTYAYRGTQCVELGLDVPVEASKVRPHVPSQYRLTGEAQGKAVMAFAFAKCERMVPQGSNRTSAVVQVDVAVMIEGGSYELAYTTSHAGIAQNASRTAFPAVHAPTSTMLGFALQRTDIVQAHIQGGNVTIDVEATALRAPATGPAGGTYYHSGPNGTSRMVYDVGLASFGPATGTLTVPTGSMLALIFGATKADGAGFYGSFNLGANLTRMSP